MVRVTKRNFYVYTYTTQGRVLFGVLDDSLLVYVYVLLSNSENPIIHAWWITFVLKTKTFVFIPSLIRSSSGFFSYPVTVPDVPLSLEIRP